MLLALTSKATLNMALNLKFLEAGRSKQFSATSQSHTHSSFPVLNERSYLLETFASFSLIMSDNEEGGDGG